MNFIKKNIKIFIIAVLSFTLLTANTVKSAEECFEKTSRVIFDFNMALDDIVLEPLSKGYNKLPVPVKKGATNFTSNVGTLLSIPNNILQGDFGSAANNSARLIINTTLGIAGIFDVASYFTSYNRWTFNEHLVL